MKEIQKHKNLKKLIIINKTDLPSKLDRSKLLSKDNSILKILDCSCRTQEGIVALEETILETIKSGKVGITDEIVVTSVRHKDLLQKTVESLEHASQTCSQNLSSELVAVDVKDALNHLGTLVGEVYTDDLLDVLFSQFCIGK